MLNKNNFISQLVREARNNMIVCCLHFVVANTKGDKKLNTFNTPVLPCTQQQQLYNLIYSPPR